MDQELTEEELQDLYAWIDKIPLSRPKRHITRDFSDGGRKKPSRLISKGAKQAAGRTYFKFVTWLLCGVWLKTLSVYLLFWDLTASPLNSCCLVMAAEVVKYFLPKLVDLHNYTPANSTQQKLSNWNVLNRQDSGFDLLPLGQHAMWRI